MLKQISQEAIKPDLQNIIAGHSVLVKVLFVIACILANIVSGILVGIIGAIACTNIFVSWQDSWLGNLSTIITIICWSCVILRQGLVKSLLAAGALTLFISLVITSLLIQIGILKFAVHLGVIVVNVIWLSTFILTFLIASFSLVLSQAVFNKQYYLITKTIQIILIVITAFLSAYIYSFLLYKPNQEAIIIIDKLSLLDIKSIAVFSGGFFGFGMVLISSLATHLPEQPWKHLDFLRTGAIAVGTWGATSFYNLDLSGVNFTGANLANTDLRARKLYRTCFQRVIGLEKARVDSKYLDLQIPKVQKLLTLACSQDTDFSDLNLRGAYLEDADLRHMKFINTDLTGADLGSADLRGSILAGAQVIDVDFTNAKLTGICIENWNVNTQTRFTNVECDFVYRRLDKSGEPSDRFPLNRNFEPREFESLYQEVENVIEIIFQEGENWQAALYSLIKLQMEDEKLELQLKGVEKRGDVWVVKVTYNEAYPKQEVEHRLNATVEEMKCQLAAKEQQIYYLEQEKYKILEIAGYQAKAIEGLSSRIPLNTSNNFFISGSNITNLAGSGQIEYAEAAAQVRSIIANSADSEQATAVLQNFLAKLQRQSVATNIETQADLMQQMILAEAHKDAILKQLLIHQEQQIIAAFGEGLLARAIQSAIAQLKS